MGFRNSGFAMSALMPVIFFVLALLPCQSQTYTMLPVTVPGVSEYRSGESAFTLYQIVPRQNANCRLIVEVPECAKQAAFIEFGFQSRPLADAQIDFKRAEFLFGKGTHQEDYWTFEFETVYLHEKMYCSLDVIFENDQIKKYRVRGPLVQVPSWRLISDNSRIHLIRQETLNGTLERFPAGPGTYGFPRIKQTPPLPEGAPVPSNE
jgi:hypothetical protein